MKELIKLLWKIVKMNEQVMLILNVHVPSIIGSLPAKIEAIQGEKVIIQYKVSRYSKLEMTFLKNQKDVTTLDDKEYFHIERDDKTD